MSWYKLVVPHHCSSGISVEHGSDTKLKMVTLLFSWMTSNNYSMVAPICQHKDENLSNYQKTGITNGQGIHLEYDITLTSQRSKSSHLDLSLLYLTNISNLSDIGKAKTEYGFQVLIATV